MPNCLFDLFLADERQIACPRICGESDTQSFQKSVVVRAGILLGREKCRRKMIIRLALEFRAAGAVFNLGDYCALSTAGFNRKVKNWFRTENAEHNFGFAPRGITREAVLCKGPGAYL